MAKSKKELVKTILGEDPYDILEDDMMALLQKKLAEDIHCIRGDHRSKKEKIADAAAIFVGSWAFIIALSVCLALWMILNALVLLHPFDEYPFFLLSLILSCMASIQVPLIVMSQNRQEKKDRLRAHNDYVLSLKAEIVIEDLHETLVQVKANQEEIMRRLAGLERARFAPASDPEQV